MNLSNAFKCRSLTPAQETELGRQMLREEMTIDRAYLDCRLNSTAFPNHTAPAMGIIKWILDLPEGHVITSGEISRSFNYNTVYNVIKKLVAGRGITLYKRLGNGKCLYNVSPDNRVVLWEILRDD